MVYKIKANKIDDSFINEIKKAFGKEEIIILDKNELKLLKAIEDIENGRNLISFTAEEFDKYSQEKLNE